MKEQDYKTEKSKSIYSLLKKNIDYKKGAIFGGLAGLAVGLINCREGLEYALSSGSKEAAKCMAIGTMNISICQKLATSIENKVKAYTLATIIPAVLSMGITYGVHAYLKGTPHPIKSTSPTALSAPFFLAIAMRARKLADKEIQNSLEDTK